MAKSIIQAHTKPYERECFLCRFEHEKENKYYEPSEDQRKAMHQHHMLHGTANRALADKLGLWCYLCPEHHEQLHDHNEYDIFLMQVAQGRFMKLHSYEEWMRIFGKNYLIM